MTPEEKFEQKVWKILQKIKESILYRKKDDYFVKYKKVPIKSKEEFDKEESILENIEDKGAIKIIGTGSDAISYIDNCIKNNPATVMTVKEGNASKYLDYILDLDVIFLQIQSKFDKIYKEYEEKFLANNANRRKNEYGDDKKLNSKTIEFNPLSAPAFDGRSVSMPSVKELNEQEKNTNREAAKRLLDKLKFEEKIKEDIKKELREEDILDKNNKGKIQKEQKINNIILVKPEEKTKKYKLIINNDFNNAKHLRYNKKTKGFINIINYEETGERQVNFDKETLDYYNSHKKCPLYSDKKYKFTKILERDSYYLQGKTIKILKINENIKTSIITERQFNNHLKKQSNT